MGLEIAEDKISALKDIAKTLFKNKTEKKN